MENVHGKEISLQYVTVKVPGQKPRGSRTVPNSNSTTNASSAADSSISASSNFNAKNSGSGGEKVLLTGYELIKEPSGGEGENNENGTSAADKSINVPNSETPNVKKRHRRMKSNGVKANQDCDDSDMFEFHIVSLDNKQWYFEASSAEERDEWVGAIEQQILNSLQVLLP